MGFWKSVQIPGSITTESSKSIGVIAEDEQDIGPRPSVFGRRSYIDDIMIPTTSRASKYEKVERLFDACDKRNLLISVAKRFWECRYVNYLDHQIPIAGLEVFRKI